jgi:hypothetical protein
VEEVTGQSPLIPIETSPQVKAYTLKELWQLSDPPTCLAG